MSKDTYLVLEIDGHRETPVRDWRDNYNPGRWEEIKIEFTVPPYTQPCQQQSPGQNRAGKTYPETDRRQGRERRAKGDRRTGSRERRAWQESRWIGAPDCRNGQKDRRYNGDRRKNPDRRRK